MYVALEWLAIIAVALGLFCLFVIVLGNET